MARCLIGLGSNLGDRRQMLEEAVRRLTAKDDLRLVARSGWFETRAVGGPQGQPPYLNGAALLETSLSPAQLLHELQQIELALGRQREVRWGPRTIDLDILLYEQLVVQTPQLVVPHPRMAIRRFVLAPAAQIAPTMVHPLIGWTVAELLQHLEQAPPYLALTGAIGAGKTSLAKRLAQRAGIRLLAERPDWRLLARFYADPAGTAWEAQLQFLRQRTRLLAADAPHWTSPAAPQSQPKSPPGANSEAIRRCEEVSVEGEEFPRQSEAEAPRDTARACWTVSDFWFDQTLAFARVWLKGRLRQQFASLVEEARQSIVRPKLLAVVDAPAAALHRRVAARNRSCERNLTAAQLERIRLAVLNEAGKPGVGPVLHVRDMTVAAATEELLLAIDGMN